MKRGVYECCEYKKGGFESESKKSKTGESGESKELNRPQAGRTAAAPLLLGGGAPSLISKLLTYHNSCSGTLIGCTLTSLTRKASLGAFRTDDVILVSFLLHSLCSDDASHLPTTAQ